LTLEFGLRCRTAFDNYRVQRADLGPKPTGKVQAGQIVRFSQNRKMVYDLRPNLDVEFMGAAVKTNAEGFRDVDHAVQKPPGVRRVVTVGDSYMFGWGVPVESGYVSVAAQNLPKWEWINLARPGYATAQEVECFRVYGLKYQPDVVILNYIGNDTELPYYIQKAPTDLSSSFLKDWLDGHLRVDGLTNPAPKYKDESKKFWTYEDDPNRVPSQYRDLVGWGAVERSFQELAELGKQHHFRVVLFCFPHSDDTAMKYARQAGFEICDFTPRLRQLMKERGLNDFYGSDLMLKPPDTHPSALLHQAGGELLAEYVRTHFP
jgi:hypothetical protein